MKRWLSILTLIILPGSAHSQGNTGQDHAKQVVSSLARDNFVRRLVEAGKVGDGVERPWQREMRQLGVKAATIEVYMTWFFGPKALTAVRVVYYTSYDRKTQITDPARLSLMKASSLESHLKAEAVRLAPRGAWADLPYPFFWPFRAATAVIIWDDPFLPAMPHMFTTFGPGKPPLVAAVGFGDLADVERLLASRKLSQHDLNEALAYTCSDSDTTILQRLIAAGADVNEINANREFGTCLMGAAWSGQPEVVRVLIRAGAKVNGPQGTCDETPLTIAATAPEQSMEILRLLLDAGANVNASNCYGLTSLMKAANHHSGSTGAVTLLLEHGASVSSKAKSGRTALSFAEEAGNEPAIKLLRAAHPSEAQ